jgi:alkanesulfonate monooxygenase SsuD/methylene tetrahydromethanopterin reductase-like flavin-dependent oxidoreductase (luciferase family)
MFGKAPVFECWTALSALASATSKVRLGTMVTSAAFRNPALLAKMASTVDVVSGGRLELGVGAGAQRDEHEAVGFSFLEPAERVGRMRETIEIVKKIWSEDKTTFNGKYYRLSNVICEPKPLQKPHPPITIAGCGEKYALEVTAKFADRFDFGFLPTLKDYKRKLGILESFCRLVGRDCREIEKSCWPAGQIIASRDELDFEKKVRLFKPKSMDRDAFLKFTLMGTPQDWLERIEPFRNLGVSHFMLFFGDLPDCGSLRLFGEYVLKEAFD